MTELFPLIARYGPKTFNGPLKVPHLGELGMIEPQLASDMYRRIFQTLPSDDYVRTSNYQLKRNIVLGGLRLSQVIIDLYGNKKVTVEEEHVFLQ